MPDRHEIMRSLYGAYRLSRLDQRGLTLFDVSVDGFWRSFFAVVLAAPAYVILVGQTLVLEPGDDLGWIALIKILVYVINWVIFPVVALLVTDMLKLGHRYTTLIVALNWAAVLQILVFLAVATVVRVLPDGPAAVLMLSATFAILFYQWFVASTALGGSGGIALALVVLGRLLNTMLNLAAERLS